MRIIKTSIPAVIVLEPTIHPDERGFFLETFHQDKFEHAINERISFVQDNLSCSIKNVLRGLHYQTVHPQGKLISVIHGKIFDVALDIRRGSETFGKHVSIELSDEKRQMLWIPEGFAHGFLTISETAKVFYKTTRYRDSESECSISWNDELLGINWPIEGKPILSFKDENAQLFKTAKTFA